MGTPNQNHFHGKTRPFRTPKRKKGKVKRVKVHKNKYERYGTAKERREKG